MQQRNKNDVQLIGRLTKNPELKYNGKQQPIAHFTLATNRQYTSWDGSTQDEATFTPVQVFGKLAEEVKDKLFEKKHAFVIGRLTNESWTDQKTGQPRSALRVTAESIIFLD